MPSLREILQRSSFETDLERDLAARFVAFETQHKHPYSRSCPTGHFTASAIILDATLTKTALLHHKKLNIWVQPGGHADGDQNLERVARKEALEETGLTDLIAPEPNAPPIALSIHEIPQYGDIPLHLHYDVRFAFRAVQDDLLVNEESHDVSWFAIDSLQSKGIDSELNEHIRKAQRTFVAARRP